MRVFHALVIEELFAHHYVAKSETIPLWLVKLKAMFGLLEQRHDVLATWLPKVSASDAYVERTDNG